jgi:hypothetical protein
VRLFFGDFSPDELKREAVRLSIGHTFVTLSVKDQTGLDIASLLAGECHKD